MSLHTVEAQGAHVLRGHVELLDAYLWHQISERRQSGFAKSCRTNPPAGHCILQMDYQENVKYPLSPCETGEEWHAQSKLSLTVFGANAIVPKRGGGHLELFILLVSDILDHDAQAADMSTNSILGELRKHPSVDWPAVQHLLIVTDCGPHFRSKENAAHFLYTLPLLLKILVEICWLGEQHGKSGVDRCFGWCNTWITSYIHTSPIHSLDDLLKCFRDNVLKKSSELFSTQNSPCHHPCQAGSSQMMREDSSGPQFLVVKWSPQPVRPSPRYVLHVANFKISRTYSMTGTPSNYAAAGVSIRNKIFSDLSPGELITWEVKEIHSPEEIPWRIGYYDQPRTWEEDGPDPGKQNSITRRFTDQKDRRAAHMPTARPSFLER
eukprot:Skav226359  [mRNA]  locus=scaffold2980:395019:396158:- [translate_table: standard]